MNSFLLFLLALCYIVCVFAQLAFVWMIYTDSKRRWALESSQMQSAKDRQWQSFDMYHRDTFEATMAPREGE